MRTRSNSQGGDTTACASSSNGEVSAGKRRKTAAQDEHVDALPTAKRPRPSADDEAHVAEPEAATAGNAEREPQPAVSAGPAAAELQGVLAPADPGAEVDGAASQPQWGLLISQYPQHPHMPLYRRTLTVGRSSSCHINFPDAAIPSELCRIHASCRAWPPKVSLQCTSSTRMLSLNGRTLLKGEKATLQGGDELTVIANDCFSFVYTPSEEPPAAVATVAGGAGAAEAAVDSLAAGQSTGDLLKDLLLGPSDATTAQLSGEQDMDTEAADTAAKAASKPASHPAEQPAHVSGQQPAEQADAAPAAANTSAQTLAAAEAVVAGSGAPNAAAAAAVPDAAAAEGAEADATRLLLEAAGLADASTEKGGTAPAGQAMPALDARQEEAQADSSTPAQPAGIAPAAAASATPAQADAAGTSAKAGTAVARQQRVTIAQGTAGTAAASRRQAQHDAFGLHLQLLETMSAADKASVARTLPTSLQMGGRQWLSSRGAAARAADPAPAADVAQSTAAGTPSSLRTEPQQASLKAHSEALEAELRSLLEQGCNQHVSWTAFPHHLGDGARAQLYNTAFLHLKRPEFAPLVQQLPGLANRVWMHGPAGSELYQEAVARALAKEMDAQLLVVDFERLTGVIADTALPPAAAAADIDGAAAGAGDDADDGMDEADWQDLADADADEGDAEAAWRASTLARPMARRTPAGGSTAFRAHMTGARSRTTAIAAAEAAAAARPVAAQQAAASYARAAAFAERTAALANGAAGSASSVFRKGDRVRVVTGSSAWGWGLPAGGAGSLQSYLGSKPGAGRREAAVDAAVMAAAGGRRGPSTGACGTVVMTFADHPGRVGVRFDSAMPGGINLGGLCPEGYGFFCTAGQLAAENAPDKGPDADTVIVNVVFDFILSASKDAPLIVYFKDATQQLTTPNRRYAVVAGRLTKVNSARVLVLAGHCESPARRPGDRGSISSMYGAYMPGITAMDSLLDGMSGRMGSDRAGAAAAQTKATRLLTRIMPNCVTFTPPPVEPALTAWKKMLEADAATLRERENRATLAKALTKCGLVCSDLEGVRHSEAALSPAQAERIVGWALSLLLSSDAQAPPPPTATSSKGSPADAPLPLPAACLQAALATHTSAQAEAAPAAQRFKDIGDLNDFEKKLLEEVIPPGEVGTCFDDIGALDNVKSALREIVMLPLQRPELFQRGALTRPTKGVLLFGPPGTGKTMLARAVAAESGANFLNISMSALASKWFGEGEKYVRALFTLAHRLAPSVIFVDEVDSMLSRRDKTGEHEAMRKIKNEFMMNWDGLRTAQGDRVLVLAATNRPADLDEAVIRRLPRRLLVDLPDAANRARILKVILRDEALVAGFSFEELAGMTDGYSGSDLKALCVAAAYRPIRDFLAAEEVTKKAAAVTGKPAAEKGEQGPVGQPAAEQGPAGQAGGVSAEATPGSRKRKAESAPEGGAEPQPPAADAAAAPATEQAAAGAAQQQDQPGAALQPAPAPAQALPAAGAAAPQALVASGSGVKLTPQLRPLDMADFKAAMKQAGASNSTDACNMNELRQWNEQYGEGGSRRALELTYFT